MGTHLFIHKMQHSDMLIRDIDLKRQLIEYQIVDKEGKPMEPIKKDKIIHHHGDIVFDKNRSLPFEYAKAIQELLNSK